MNVNDLSLVDVSFNQAQLAHLMGCAEQFDNARKRYTYLALRRHLYRPGQIVLVNGYAGLTVAQVQAVFDCEALHEWVPGKWIISRVDTDAIHDTQIYRNASHVGGVAQRRTAIAARINALVDELNTNADNTPLWGPYHAHIVQPGDTMAAIAQHHQLSLTELVRHNPQIADPDLIYPNEHIRVPLSR